jgi:uncharacterized protein (DUF1330 family)
MALRQQQKSNHSLSAEIVSCINYRKTNDIVDYLETSVNEILLIGTKLFLKLETNEEAENQLSSIEISEFDSSNELQKTFISETLLNFDQILRITLLDIWRFKI